MHVSNQHLRRTKWLRRFEREASAMMTEAEYLQRMGYDLDSLEYLGQHAAATDAVWKMRNHDALGPVERRKAWDER
jgi:hypothetical protein